jgi:glutamate dehydrogenase (NAD(P)+)
MENIFDFADELGPAKVIHVFEPCVQLKAVLVIDNVAVGPAIGGVRMASDVSTAECVRLARAMTLKNAAAGLPHGGGKIVLYGDPSMPRQKKEQLIRALAGSLRTAEEYIFAPDMGTNEKCMTWIKDEIGRAVGLPRELGGIPLDEIGATGFGLTHVAKVALGHCGFDLKGARLVVQGFGAVGKHAAKFLTDQGAVLVGVADSRGTIQDPDGLDVDGLIELKRGGKSVTEHPHGQPLAREAVVGIECDIWIPAARPDVIHKGNVDRLKTRLVIQGANIPVTLEAEQILHDRGVLCVPDFIANAGGVICAAMEYRGASESAVFTAIEEKLRRNTEQVLVKAKVNNVTPREAALELGTERIKKAMGLLRWSLFSNAPQLR